MLLTNGIEWRLYHLTFNQGEGIAHDLAFDVNLLEQAENHESMWAKLELLTRSAVRKDALEDFWAHRKALSPASVVRVLFHEDVLRQVRRHRRKDAEAMLYIEEVFSAVRDVLSQEALAEAGELGITKRRRRRRRKTDEVTGQVVELEEDDAEEAAAPTAPEVAAPPQPAVPPKV